MHFNVFRDKKETKDKKRRRRKKDEKNEAGSDNEKCDTDDDIEDDVERLTMMENSTSGVENSTMSDHAATGFNACDTQSDSKDSIFTVSIGPQSSQTHSSVQSINVTSHGDSKFWPCARMNAQLAVRSGVLYLYGGLYEEGDKQVTLQDMYALDLHKLDEWKTLIKNQAHELVSPPVNT